MGSPSLSSSGSCEFFGKTSRRKVADKKNRVHRQSPGQLSLVCRSQRKPGEVITGEEVEKEVHVCEVCKYSASHQSDLKQHMLTHSTERLFRCAHCEVAFKSPHYLKRHMRIHTGEKPYRCKDCCATFTHYYSWQIHSKTHTGEKPWLCTECGLAFSEPSNLQRHRQTHSGERPYLCSLCGLAFARAGNLKSHLRVHTGEKPFSCSQCKASFSHLTNLKLHRRSHSGEKPFQCQECGARLSSSGALKTHRRIHTGEKPFSCQECDACFRQISHLQKHVRVHHGRQVLVSDKQATRKPASDQTSDHHFQYDHGTGHSCSLITPVDAHVAAQTFHIKGLASPSHTQASMMTGQPHISPQNMEHSLSVSEQSCLQSLVMMQSQQSAPGSTTSVSHPVSVHLHALHGTQAQSAAAGQDSVLSCSQATPAQNTPSVTPNMDGKDSEGILGSHSLSKQSSTGIHCGSLAQCTETGMVCEEQDIRHTAQGKETDVEDQPQAMVSGPGPHKTLSRYTDCETVLSAETTGSNHDTILCREHQSLSSVLGRNVQNLGLSSHLSTDHPADSHELTLESQKLHVMKSNNSPAYVEVPAKQLSVEMAEHGGYDWLEGIPVPDQGNEKFPSQMHASVPDHNPWKVDHIQVEDTASALQRSFQMVGTDVGAQSSNSDTTSENPDNALEKLSLHMDGISAQTEVNDIPTDVDVLQDLPRKTCLEQNAEPTSTSGDFVAAQGCENSITQQLCHQSLEVCGKTDAAVATLFSYRAERQDKNVRGDKQSPCSFGDETTVEVRQSLAHTKQEKCQEDGMQTFKVRPFLCPHFCDAFTRAGNLKTHFAAHTGEKSIDCDQCQAVFNRLWNLKPHIQCHKGERRFCCEHCGASLRSAGALKVHLRIHNGERPFPCDDCSASFRLAYQLQKHASVHHADVSAGLVSKTRDQSGEKTSSCTESFQHQNSLKIHRKTHSKGKPYPCEECGAYFSERSNLQRHLATHTGERPFLCAQCGIAFARAGNLKSHMGIHSGDKPFACDKCNAQFNRSWNLKLHLRSHTGEKAFTCQQCGASLSSSGALKTHMRIHTGEKPFVCKSCGATFRQMGQLQKHVRIHHSFTKP